MGTNLFLICKGHSSGHCVEEGYSTGLVGHLGLKAKEVFMIVCIPPTIHSAILNNIDINLLHISLYFHNLGLLFRNFVVPVVLTFNPRHGLLSIEHAGSLHAVGSC